MRGPYLTLPQAAEYCGYSTDHFREILKGYAVPTYGPKNNRYRAVDLDAWMENPDEYKPREQAVKRRGQNTWQAVVV